MLVLGICEHYKQLCTVPCFLLSTSNKHIVYCRHPVTTGIGIGTRYRSKQKVLYRKYQ